MTQQEVVLAIEKAQFARVAVPGEAEMVEAPGVREGLGSRVVCREGRVHCEGRVGVLDGDARPRGPLVAEAAPLRLVPLAAEAEVFPEAPRAGT